jgi:hypothetical protein
LVSFTAGASYQIHFMLFLAGFYFRSGHFFFYKKKKKKKTRFYVPLLKLSTSPEILLDRMSVRTEMSKRSG